MTVSLFALALVFALALGAQAQTGAPSISDVGAREITDTTALLAGTVNPNGSHTTYRFEYGTDTTYGSTTAVDNVGSGSSNMAATKALTGLQPATTYHFRLVATNAAGETAGPDGTFMTAANPPQPSGRAYEMVSPLDKNGGHVDRDWIKNGLLNQSGAAASGEAAAFTSRLQFAGTESGAIEPTYVARRSGDGWRTEGVTPPIGNVNAVGSERPQVMGLSLDLSRAFTKTAALLTPGAEQLAGSWGLYMRSSGAAQRYTLLSDPDRCRDLPPAECPSPTLDPPESPTATGASSRFEYVADTPDSRHVVLNSGRQLLPTGPEGTWGEPRAVYEWVNGHLRLASVPPTGMSFSTEEPAAAGAVHRSFGGATLPGDNVISDDGRRLFFTARVSNIGSQLFVREDGATTVHVSRSERPDPQAAGNASFWGAKGSDGSVAFFQSDAPLTPGAAPRSLYRWDADALEGGRLTELWPNAIGPAAVSDDGTGVAFVAGATLEEAKLYLWRQGQGVRQIAAVDATTAGGIARDSRLWLPQPTGGGRAARISADGDRVLFASFAKQPNIAYDITESTPAACGSLTAPGERCRQIYLYDARSDTLSCLTCVPGVPVTDNADLFGNSEDGRTGDPAVHAPYRQPRNLSADGTRAFFETARPLVTADRNSRLDVYEWEDRDLDGQGELRLISPGRGSSDSEFIDASLSGDDVFFTTREQLVGLDTDNLGDLYDARVGGGIPAQNPPPVSSCLGEVCQGAFSGPPFLPGLGSGGASHGDARPGPRPSFSVARLSRAQLARLARGRAVAVRVRTNRPGRLRLSARAKLGARMRTVGGGTKRAPRAGTVRLPLKLSRQARRELARKGRLNVRLAVRFAGVREARTSMLRLRRAGSGERGTR